MFLFIVVDLFESILIMLMTVLAFLFTFVQVCVLQQINVRVSHEFFNFFFFVFVDCVHLTVVVVLNVLLEAPCDIRVCGQNVHPTFLSDEEAVAGRNGLVDEPGLLVERAAVIANESSSVLYSR